jgi:VWFA-related protein
MSFPARPVLALLLLSSSLCAFVSAQSDSQTQPPKLEAIPSNTPTFRATVRRVVVDVVVRDSNNQPVHGLTAKDFVVAEDGRPQNVVSFDVHDFTAPSISLPPNAPHLATNNFVNIPPIPERGPLFLILYDLVDTEPDDQMDARRQIMKFIKNKPDGTRFAVFVRSDGLYLVQGFTADKDLLYSVLDPANPKPHVPRVFMMGRNLGYGDPASMMNVLTQVSEFMEGVPGHKNLIWLAGTFPLALAPRKEDPLEYEDQIIEEINVLTRAQVAVYPINVSGVPVNPPGALTGARVHGGNANQTVAAGSTMSGGGPGENSLSSPLSGGVLQSIQTEGSGDSAITDYDVQKSIAEATGGHAFYNTNDLTASLNEATDIGGNYYSLSYSPSNVKDDGGRRSIRVKLIQPQSGYKLSYRRFYFTTALRPAVQVASADATSGAAAPPDANDTLQSNMKHGAPMVHDLLFAAHVHSEGAPVRATAEQMSQLAELPAYASTRHKDKDKDKEKDKGDKDKPLPPIDLQRYAIDYRVTDSALKSPSAPPASFEFAAAAFDAESSMLNGVVNNAVGDAKSQQESSKTGVFRVRQELDVPVNATWIRIGVRDKLTNRVGTLEFQLPLAPEPPTPAVTSAR